MLTRLDLRGTSDLAGALERDVLPSDDVDAAVREIIAGVRSRGDAALRELTLRFDGATIDDLEVPRVAVDAALEQSPSELRDALDLAADRIRVYHEAQALEPEVRVSRYGIDVAEVVVPVQRAGLYVPGGRAAYPSTVLMTAIPARVAGVDEIVLCTPPGPDGTVPAPTLAAAALAGVDAVYRVGGAQAVAVMAYGTESIRRVDVVVGPGNAYVAAAKRAVAGVVGIDAVAGPSEVVVVADTGADPGIVAADLLAQAEHGPGGTAVLVAWDPDVIDAVDAALFEQLTSTPRRDDVEATLRTGGQGILVVGPAEAVDVVNEIAPEHVELLVRDPDALVPLVRNAGAVFCGPWAPAALGDYVAGVNHVLPTSRAARFSSALRVDTFRKRVHVVRATEDGLVRVASALGVLAAAEGLPAHARSVEMRAARRATKQVTS